MKINFHTAYADLRVLLNAPVKPDLKADGFGKLLGELEPKSKQTIENTAVATAQPEPERRIERGPMASFNFARPELYPPPAERISPEVLLPDDVNPSNESVNTPSVVSARRINSQPPLRELHLEQRISAIETMVENLGKEHGVDPTLGMAVIAAESSFNPDAISRDGHASKGLFQLLDKTGKELHQTLAREGSYDPFDPARNIDLGLAYLRQLHDTFAVPRTLSNDIETASAENLSSLEKLAVAAFNAGEGRVASAQQRASRDGYRPGLYEHIEPYLPETTREYVKKVMSERENLTASAES